MRKAGKVWAAILVPALILSGTGVWMYRKNKYNKTIVSVIPVSSVYTTDYGSMTSVGGTLTNQYQQAVYLSSSQKAARIAVKEGDKVKPGDVLIELDTTEEQLNLSDLELQIEQKRLDIANGLKRLNRLRNTAPYSEPGWDGGWDDGWYDPGWWDEPTEPVSFTEEESFSEEESVSEEESTPEEESLTEEESSSESESSSEEESSSGEESSSEEESSADAEGTSEEGPTESESTSSETVTQTESGTETEPGTAESTSPVTEDPSESASASESASQSESYSAYVASLEAVVSSAAASSSAAESAAESREAYLNSISGTIQPVSGELYTMDQRLPGIGQGTADSPYIFCVYKDASISQELISRLAAENKAAQIWVYDQNGKCGYVLDLSLIVDTVIPDAAAQETAPTPTAAPTETPTAAPTAAPTETPTAAPTAAPTETSTAAPTAAPTETPTAAPTETPTAAPTETPTAAPTAAPTEAPTPAPTAAPTEAPTAAPTAASTADPAAQPAPDATEQTGVSGVSGHTGYPAYASMQVPEGARVVYAMQVTLDHAGSPSSDLIAVKSIFRTLAYEDTDGAGDSGDSGGTVTLPTSDTEDFSGMTAEDLNAAIHQQEVDLRDMDLERRKLELKYSIQTANGTQSEILSTVNGTVRDMQEGGAEDWDYSKPLFIVDSGKGFYVNGTVSENQLPQISVGDTVECVCYQTDAVYCEATITGISDYPADSLDETFIYASEGSPDASYYPFTAYIESSDQTAGLVSGTYCELSLNVEGDADALYIDSMYIRKEGMRHYVWVRDPETELLTKRYVTLGKTLWGSYSEIRSGLTLDDYIAVPFGKDVKEGAKTQISDGTEGMGI